MAAAYAALVSLMHTIHEIEHHHAPPISLDKKQAQSLTQNITFLQEFLESYNYPVSDDDDELANPQMMLIADAAYAVEDIIESHVVDTVLTVLLGISISPWDVFKSINFHENLLEWDLGITPNQTKPDEQIKSINFYQNLQQAIEDMDLIKKIAVIPAAAPAASASSTFSTGPSSTSVVVVGFEEASLEIMEKLTEDRPDRQVIPIVGMGGIGKTTLARYVFYHKLTKDRFDICAWATISQQYDTREIFSEVFSQVIGKDKKQISEAELGSELHKCLFGRRFLIVMDDMWSIDAWNEIQHLFPNNQNGSRILVTTRLLELSSQLNKDYSHQVGFLDEASSWDLFSKIVFGEKNICPSKLKKIAKKVVDGCRGLPLSIIVVGGLLKKMDATQRCWELIESNLTSKVNLENDKHCLRLLRLSYNHLPIHLKPCFLYMGVFEEDASIRVSTLVKLWISEGFVRPLNGESLETSGVRFLKDLIDRNLILISKLGSTGNIKSCKIHDLLRDLCLKEGQKDGFHNVIGQCGPRSINNRHRRIVVPRNASRRKVFGKLISMPHARSVMCEDGNVIAGHYLRLLRTFHAYNNIFWDGQSYTHSFALQYVNLRHLTIYRGNMSSSFLSSIGLLWNLHTIIVSSTKTPTDTILDIWKMPQFRHIEFIDYTLCLRDPPSIDDDAIIMENLQVLKGVRDFKCSREVVKRIPNIKKLKIRFTGTNVDEFYGINNIKLLCKLESLRLGYGWLPHLHNLTFPHSLKSFSGSIEWEESIFEKMGSLPFLEKLRLMYVFFGTGRWEIVEGQFPSLKYLKLSSCSGLELWTAAEEDSFIFPCLEHISLSYLKELKTVPREIGNIATLQRIRIENCNEAVIKSTKEMVEEQMLLQGDQLPFRVVVKLFEMTQELHRMTTGPNFEVRLRR